MTEIEWTHIPGYTGKSWNPVTGCQKIAQGCRNCYAEAVANRFWGERKFTDVQTHADRLGLPLRRRKPTCYFVNSMSDLFHEAVPFEFIAAVYGVMAACPQHTFIILTKRPARMREFFGVVGSHGSFGHYVREDDGRRKTLREVFNAVAVNDTTNGKLHRAARDPWMQVMNAAALYMNGRPFINVIHGYSASTQADLDAGIGDLLATPSALRCLSLEPLIGPVDVAKYITCRCDKNGNCDVCLTGGIDWVLVGGESGPGARPCDIEWIRSIVEQCKAAGALCFVKQLGSRPVADFYDDEARVLYDDALEPFPDPDDWDIDMNGQPPVDSPVSLKIIKDRKGADPSEWPDDLRVREYPEVTRG